LALGPNSFWKMPKVPGPHTSWVISLSTLVQMLSPAAGGQSTTWVDLSLWLLTQQESLQLLFPWRRHCCIPGLTEPLSERLARIFSVMVMARLTCNVKPGQMLRYRPLV
jgi:hypothetical protein